MPDAHATVDYEQAARVYDRGRSVADEAMVRWTAAVRDRLPAGRVQRAADIGAGTGNFLPLWAALGLPEIVAVEPSAAMRARAVAKSTTAAQLVGASAAALPMATAALDVAWLSTVIHHVSDLDALAAELGRVVRPGGRVLVRGYFPGTSVVPWIRAFPQDDRLTDRFPTVARWTAALDRAGLRVVDVVNVPEPQVVTGTVAADFTARMRAADSVITLYDDAEIDATIGALAAQGDTELGTTALTLVTAVA